MGVLRRMKVNGGDRKRGLVVASSQTITPLDAVELNASGQAILADGSGISAGVYLGEVTATAGDTIETGEGEFLFSASGSITVAHIGRVTYSVDENTVSLDPTDGKPRGVITGVETAGVWVSTSLLASALLSLPLGGIARVQKVSGTWASGTATIATGITVTAATTAFAITPTEAVTGSTNVATPAHIKASNVAGAPGTGSVTIVLLGANGAVDSDAAGDFEALLID